MTTWPELVADELQKQLIRPHVSRGHMIGQTFRRYPHVCPGWGCAVQRWLRDHPAKVLDTAERKSEDEP